MDKRIVYAGAIPVDLDWLEPQRNIELALGYLMQAAFGTSTVIDGLTVAQQASPNMTVQVGTGSIINYTTVDPTGVAYGAMALNTSNLVKIGINATSVNMSALTAPAVAGQSQNWLVEAKFLEADGSAVVLPYYNASNPTLPYTGPANAGTSQNTRRTGTVQLQWKAGTAATTGQQNTPSPDSGWVGVAIVTVANGQASITNSNITPYFAAPFVPTKLPQQRQKLTANLTIYCSPFGNDSANSGLSAASPFATLQKAWNVLQNNFDLNGFAATVQLANGTYSAGLVANGTLVGQSAATGITLLGNTGSPSSVTVSVTGNAFTAQDRAAFTVSGVTMVATGSAISAGTGSHVVIGLACVFGACGNHVLCAGNSIVEGIQNYSITGAAASHWNASGGIISISSCTITVTGTPAFSSAFAFAQSCGVISTSSLVFSGSATGARYSATTNAVIGTGGVTFPGASGTTGAGSTGGQVT